MTNVRVGGKKHVPKNVLEFLLDGRVILELELSSVVKLDVSQEIYVY